MMKDAFIPETFQYTEKINILLVDDEEKNLFTLEEVLRPLDENLVTAKSGKEALQLILKYDFAVVILDVKMPEIDGYQVAKLMRRRAETRETPIIFVTGFNDGNIGMFRGYDVGAVDYLLKPIEPAVLLCKTKVFVDLHRKTRALERQKEIALAELQRNRRLNRENIALEKRKREAEQFAYIASHDLQTPLRHVMTYVDFLREELGSEITDSQKEAIDIVLKGTEFMKRMIRDLLSLSQIGRRSLESKPVHLQELLDDIVDSMRNRIDKCGAEISFSNLPVIMADGPKLRQVFQNLIDNSLKYSREDVPPRIQIEATATGDQIELSVIDNGVGIDPKQCERVFEIFQRLHPPNECNGTGIGLAICKKIVELHDGEICAVANDSHGMTVKIVLPTGGSNGVQVGSRTNGTSRRGPANRCQIGQYGRQAGETGC